jgi:hypothetical protein
MKSIVVVLASLLFSVSALAQRACREASATTVETQESFAIMRVVLPSSTRGVIADAVIPVTEGPRGAVVFTLSKLVASDPDRSVELTPFAIDIAKEGRPVVIIERTLTLPHVSSSPEHKEQVKAVICAEQWLSAHSAVRPNDWTFVGPGSDVPTFKQLETVGGSGSMTFHWGLAIGDSGDDKNTEKLFRGEKSVLLALHDSEALRDSEP